MLHQTQKQACSQKASGDNIMKNLLFALILCLAALAVNAQKISKPTLTPVPETAEQTAAIREGIDLHDAKNFDAAIVKYNSVLAENPDSTLALYELAMTYYTKGDLQNAMETSVRGSKYKADTLPLFYGIMANILDDLEKPEEALKIYKDALKILDGDPKFIRHIAEIHFNMGITYFRMNKLLEARNEAKKAIELDYSAHSAHYILSELYYGSQYKVPALAAALRFSTIELNTTRSKRTSAIVMLVLAPAKKSEDGSINIFMNLNAPKDEGDYGMYELLLGTLGVIDKDKEKGEKPKTEAERFQDSLSTFIGLLGGDKKLKETFVGKQYVPFLIDLKAAGHLEALANLIRFQSGVGGEESKQWITANIAKISAMNKWAKEYHRR